MFNIMSESNQENYQSKTQLVTLNMWEEHVDEAKLNGQLIAQSTPCHPKLCSVDLYTYKTETYFYD